MTVCAGWDNDMTIGTLFVTSSCKMSFEFDETWRQQHSKIFLDPDLSCFKQGRQFLPSEKSCFGFLSDASPDRWGRTLIRRREAAIAKAESRKPKFFDDFEYLIAVDDATRIGGLRFKQENEPAFLSDSQSPVPTTASIRELEDAIRRYECSGEIQKNDRLLDLLAPGSSLGGARPKACVRDEHGELWIAKFPSVNDAYDVGAWEYLLNRLAAECGIDTPEAFLQRIRGRSIFFSKRFDRQGNQRIHFASGMTILGLVDNRCDATGYYDIAQFINELSDTPERDVLELYKRIAFNIATSNTDDHLRNHGFLLDQDGTWRLSPAYDINPSPYSRGFLSLNVNENDPTATFETLLSSAPLYGISENDTKHLIEEVEQVVQSRWRHLAKDIGIPRNEVIMMKEAFSERFEPIVFYGFRNVEDISEFSDTTPTL